MKQIITPILLAFSLVGCIGNDDGQKPAEVSKAMADSTNFTTIQWIDSVKSFDKITEGQKLEISFRFKNTGNKPLIIASAIPGCGCTIAEKPEKPILPGQEGIIRGEFDSNGKSGSQTKGITVQANTKPVQSHNLQFNVEVIKKG